MMGIFTPRSVRALVTSTLAVALVVACGSEGASTFGSGNDDTDAGGGLVGNFGGNDTVDGGSGKTSCVPLTCADQGITCGPAGDGCGGIIQCGTCGEGMRCGGPNAPSQCVPVNLATGCTPKTCEEVGAECGLAGDGCGGILQCPSCPAGFQCGGIGAPSRCVQAVPTSPDGGTCVQKTVADYLAEHKDCGEQSDGCGGTINLGGCPQGEFCGGGGPSKCGVPGGGNCVPKTCAAYPGKCGPQPNGCGGVTENCGTCTAPAICGGGGVPSECGGGGVMGPDGGQCQRITTCAPNQCGIIADGCGGTLDCGMDNCKPGELCGGGGTENVCAPPPCERLTICPAGLNCGVIADGCGGTIECGPPDACQAPAICGGGGQPNVCGGGTVVADGGGTCIPITTCQSNQCGYISNGCGDVIKCPDCTGGAVCGGGGPEAPNLCAGGTCIPRTQADCAALGFNCGFIADGCGGEPVQCGATCPNGGICGLNSPNVCSTEDATCTGFCQNQAKDCGASPTRITGKVFAPNGTLPIPDALIYVPNGATTPPYGVAPITAGVAGAGTCDSCNTQASGNPLVSTRSAADGSFTLNDVPAGVPFPIVIQLGKWRRMVTIPATTKCTSRTLTAEQTRLPKRQNEGNNNVDNIPLVAISTGSIDGLECVFAKLGITSTGDGNQFSKGNENGRIRLYRNASGGSAGARIGTGTTPSATTLWGSQAELDKYDAVIFGCGGPPGNWQNGGGSGQAAAQDRLRLYANKGGRVFATHYQHVWISTNDSGPNPEWEDTVNWDTSNERYSTSNGGSSTTPQYGGYWDAEVTLGPAGSKRRTFAEWLSAPGVNAALTPLNNPPRIRIIEARNNADRNVSSNAEEWLTRQADPNNTSKAVLHYTFNTPLGAQNQCGRVLFSDFHVSIGDTSDAVFPNHCNTNGGQLTEQEKVLAFFLFDLTSCIEQQEPPRCQPKTCNDYPQGTCGRQSDGCGDLTANCGTCPPGQTCGGGGTPSRCGVNSSCTPKTCAPGQCGQIPDGCGNLLTCPGCPEGQTCGGGGVANQCGAPSCTKLTCEDHNANCGQQSDGCGGILECGDCPDGQTCGGGGVPNQCGAPACERLTQCPPGKNCGQMPDGCGGVVDCGICPNGQTCGGGGAPNVCGAASCSPKKCEDVGAQCGTISDQCGGTVLCGQCPQGSFCNGQNLCVAPTCTPKTCEELGVECGPAGDTCGGLLDCKGCPEGTACGAGGEPGKCGVNPCTPATCANLEADCGQLANGCGGLTPSCGTCEGNLSCSNGKCIQACVPRTCEEAQANCGPIADGCGGIVDCGTCPDGETCGYNGRANVCGSSGPK